MPAWERADCSDLMKAWLEVVAPEIAFTLELCA
jgi:hypothetical protein